MTQEQRYCKRLIEVDLPIKRISEHARREKSIRHGHISTMHIWWARRPLGACRAVILASLWPDPVDSRCPERFKKEAARIMKEFRDRRGGKPCNWDNPLELRNSLLNFIADFANWDNSTNLDFIEVSRSLTQIAHESLGGNKNSRPMVADPFSGGGSIPLEALRVGSDAFASDLNPVAVLLNKVLLEYIPKFGHQLASDLRDWGIWVKRNAEKELKEFYPTESNGSIPIAYVWAWTIFCEGPGCGVIVPMLKGPWIAKNRKNKIGIKLNYIKNKPHATIINSANENNLSAATTKRFSVICPKCGYTTSVERVRVQLKQRGGGNDDLFLLAVVTTKSGEVGKKYREATEKDIAVINRINAAYVTLPFFKGNSVFPNETLPLMSGVFNAPIYGIDTWGKLFTKRQAMALMMFAQKIQEAFKEMEKRGMPKERTEAIVTLLGLALDKVASRGCNIAVWNLALEKIEWAFLRQAIPMVSDFPESNPISDGAGNWEICYENIASVVDNLSRIINIAGTVERFSATQHHLPSDSVDVVFTDPPYYNAVPYADLSDFCYIWLRRSIGFIHPDLFKAELAPKDEEITEMAGWDPDRYKHKDRDFFQREMQKAMQENRRILTPYGVSVVVFAHKTTESWEAQLQALFNAGWIISASWPIDTERPNRPRAIGSAALASSIHLVCRPRENIDGSLIKNSVGDWRDILQELPGRIHDWMPRLAQEGVVGADAIFACLGPALEIFSRYSQVEKANGEKVGLREYLEQVWAAVAKEALNMIFEGARTEGFEEDSRLTAMWLWTLSTSRNGNDEYLVDEEEAQEEEVGPGNLKISGFTLEYDAARKIAQGLGAHLEELSSVIRVDGEKATLLPVGERVQYLFGKSSLAATSGRRKKKENQMTLFEEFNKVEEQGWSLGDEKSSVGKTILDRLHQAMILFGAGRAEALRRFLVEEGIGKDERFWRLAQALSALYPSQTDEKRWVDGVLARKKSLGF